MLFTHEENSYQFDLSCGNRRVPESSGNSEESGFGNDFKHGPSVSPLNFSLSWLPGENCQSATFGHDKRPHSDVRPYQVACKRPKQTCETPFPSEVEIPASAIVEEPIETKQLSHNPCNDSSDIPSLNREQSVGMESLYSPDWVTSFPGYFEDCGPVAGCNLVDNIYSPVHEYLSRKGVPIGPEHQADIPDWRPRSSVSIPPSASGSCAGTDYHSICTSESVSRVDDCESDKWIRHRVIPMSFVSSSVGWIGDNKIHCDCSDEGSVCCARRHIIEAKENLKMSLGQDKFHELGLCEMGEDVAQRWTDEEEKRFERVVLSNPVSSGKNFWDHLPHALPSKTSKDFVSYYFNVFMLRKRAQQNRSDLLHVDSDDDELHGEPSVKEQEEENSAVETPTHEHFINIFTFVEDDKKEC